MAKGTRHGGRRRKGDRKLELKEKVKAELLQVGRGLRVGRNRERYKR